ncbi:tRNA(5-methylaminomethyl-2-thiouridylate)-methyl transferase [Pirellula staleyi DSM 6068]|uniref:tRNA-specific 2-thiouridylase MnmA n=1 Tax=Pirellula staleyi (strain ATCC 27377 / DSM 6068 / ICPB 4128) TaxID=530564 RepID=D2R405_PIRSD|nr:tRNA 2-thiouridine(34) synthase MnmA [Pirellula staleyi]ADB18854.1 tRNA(5-methylaminomethyl-2-thiouridylate)-methyl transferase [Pirellula staleyi DSM 6068]
MSRIVLAMSGGVDSSVAAAILTRAGHEVIGVFMRHGEEAQAACAVDAPGFQLPIFKERSDHKQGCCSASDAEDARRVADRLDIPFYALNLQSEFRQIIDYFIDEYTVGRTPNPCVQCNNWLKFGKLFDYADSVGAEFVATGHYARLAQIDGDLALCRGVDDGKDQSYVLFGIKKELLPRMLLPIGDYYKPQIRKLAHEIGLRVADKRDSQEICFVTSGKHDEFVRARRPDIDTRGEIVTMEGKVLGQHAGIERFTIGQRRGLGVALGERAFVVRIEPDTHRVVVGTRDDLARTALTAANCNWHTTKSPVGAIGEPFRCEAKIRYNSDPAPATAVRLTDDRLQVDFDEPRHGVAPGQAVVVYDGDRVLGGGWIE